MATDSVLSVIADTDVAMITVAELATHLGIDGQINPNLVNCAKAASKLVENYCSTQFSVRNYAEIWRDLPYWVTVPYDIRLKRQQVTAISSIIDAAGGVVLPSNYEIINQAAGIIRLYDSAPFSLAADRWKLTINYTAGFDPIPEDLKRAVLDVAQKLFRQTGTTEGDVQAESIGDWSATYGKAFMSGPVRGILDTYRVLNLW